VLGDHACQHTPSTCTFLYQQLDTSTNRRCGGVQCRQLHAWISYLQPSSNQAHGFWKVVLLCMQGPQQPAGK
jgi:hypothetical protein